MPTPAENLITRRDAILSELASMSSSTAGGKPNSSGGGDMVHVDHVGYRKSLYEELDRINSMIVAIEGTTEIETLGEV